MSDTSTSSFGVVVIGRNEGDRLRVCLQSVASEAACVVYVDSGSTDGSVALARSVGADVVELDMTVPFTAARARNAGFARLRQLEPGVQYVQFVDGDCEVVEGWCELAVNQLRTHPELVAVFGRRRERFPLATPYNRLCDMEWDTPVGVARSFGGDVMVRAEALASAGGYRESLIAGEEPELCVRLRQAGWQLRRLHAEMTRHDAAIRSFGQWWKRARRGGHAFAEGSHLHGEPPERHYVRETRRALLWGLALPAGILLGAIMWPPFLLGFLVYPLQVLRIFLKGRRPAGANLLRAVFLVLARFPEAQGCVEFMFNRLTHRRSVLIEYK